MLKKAVGPPTITPGSTGDRVELDPSRAARSIAPEASLMTIVKVTRDDYVPEGVVVRARITPRMFTAPLEARTLERLGRDPLVETIGPARPLESDYPRRS